MLIFQLEGMRHALPAEAVGRVFRMVEVTPLAEPCPPVCGVIDFQGQIVPVIDTRELFHLPCREAELSDRMILIEEASQRAVLWVDNEVQMRTLPKNHIVMGEQIPKHMRSAAGVIRDPGGMIVLHDPTHLLSCLSDWPGANPPRNSP